jgi:hypothetical protein
MSQQILSSPGKTLSDVLAHSKQLSAMQREIDKILPEEFKPYCQVASLNQGCLKFVASSAVWATRLRYFFPELLSRLRKQRKWSHLTGLDCKIVLTDTVTQKPKIKLRLSPEVAETINDVADGIKDPTLSQAMKRLAKHGQ